MVRTWHAACGRATGRRHSSGPHLSGRGRAVVLGALAVLAVLGSTLACRREYRRIPYIPPDLAGWSEPYRGTRGLRLHVFASTGALTLPRGILGGSWFERVTLEVPAFLVEHPRAGAILIGTGLDPALERAAEKRLGWLVATVAAPMPHEGADVVSQLERLGIDPATVRHVILPDSRFPQTGEIGRFPDAEVIVAARERVWALGTGAGSGVRRRDLVEVKRWRPVAFKDGTALGTVPRAHDLIGDGSLWLLDLPGYTPGSVVVLVRLPGGPVALGGGVVPHADTLRGPRVPAVATDPDAWWLSAWRLKRFRELATGLVVVPGFEAAAADLGGRRDVTVHHRTAKVEAGATSGQTPWPRTPARPPTFPVPDPPALPPPPPR